MTTTNNEKHNPLWREQRQFLDDLPEQVRDNLFSSDIEADVRAEVWDNQAILGETLINQYAWATPDDRAVNIIKQFSPIIEIGCGRNAYWANLLQEAGVDVIAYDVSPANGGQVGEGGTQTQSQSQTQIQTQRPKKKYKKSGRSRVQVRRGGPEVLRGKKIRKSDRSLLLCYPDEGFLVGGEEEDESSSLGSACLDNFSGTHVIHVGELFGDSISMLNAPFGRSSAPLYQQRLAGEYHCLLKASLQNYLHCKDTISVWKRSKRCTIVFEGENEESSDEETDYKDIPVEERLPLDVASPAWEHLLRLRPREKAK